MLRKNPASAVDSARYSASRPSHRFAGRTKSRQDPLDLLQRGSISASRHATGALQELADSIKAQASSKPIVVRLVGEATADHRALRNHCGRTSLARRALAGLHEIPAVIRRVADEAAVAMSLIENIQREKSQSS